MARARNPHGSSVLPNCLLDERGQCPQTRSTLTTPGKLCGLNSGKFARDWFCGGCDASLTRKRRKTPDGRIAESSFACASGWYEVTCLARGEAVLASVRPLILAACGELAAPSHGGVVSAADTEPATRRPDASAADDSGESARRPREPARAGIVFRDGGLGCGQQGRHYPKDSRLHLGKLARSNSPLAQRA